MSVPGVISIHVNGEVDPYESSPHSSRVILVLPASVQCVRTETGFALSVQGEVHHFNHDGSYVTEESTAQMAARGVGVEMQKVKSL
jgi:hypothetical protein